MPFTARFDTLTTWQRVLYFGTLAVAGAAAMLPIAPTSHHRVPFRCGDKPHLVRISNRYAIAGLVCVGISMVGSLVLVGDGSGVGERCAVGGCGRRCTAGS